MTTVKDEKWVSEELNTPQAKSSFNKRAFSNGVNPNQAIRLGTIINERRSGDKILAGLANNYYNQLPFIQEKQKDYLKSIKSSTQSIEDRFDSTIDENSPTKSA